MWRQVGVTESLLLAKTTPACRTARAHGPCGLPASLDKSTSIAAISETDTPSITGGERLAGAREFRGT
ncbi:MAG: hypothetical protein ACI841_003192 [Planctomycetota bacterium]|jgi:hypothetical protein